MKLIKSVEELKEVSATSQLNCFIALRGGARSSKHILFDSESKLFEILNEIDGSFQELTKKNCMQNPILELHWKERRFFSIN
jgi:hypothetical protein